MDLLATIYSFMADKHKAASRTSKRVKLLLKIAITTACLWYVAGKIDFAAAWTIIKNADSTYLLLALLAFIFSKILAAIRLAIYFKNIDLFLSYWQNIKLYWLGMFYNLFLPGSIGGDAYKVILLKKKYNASYKKTTAAVLLDRFSGLLGLGVIVAVYSSIILDKDSYIIAITGAAILAIVLLYFIVSRWLKEFIASYFPTLLLGILVQGCQVICAYLILAALGINENANEYIFIFLTSSVVSVLPLTIGGIGIREFVFLEGSNWFGLSQETSVVISLLFYLITVLTSAVGLVYVFNDPLPEKDINAFT